MTFIEPPVTKPGNVLTSDVTETSFVIKFQQVIASDRAIGYEIEIVNENTGLKIITSDIHDKFGVPTRSKTVSGLQDFVVYLVRIRAINRVGPGPWSDQISVTTKGKKKNVKIFLDYKG